MAVIAPITAHPHRGVITVTWSSIASGDTCSPATMYAYPDKTATLAGTFTTGTVTLQGSNDDTNYFSLVDAQGNAIAAATGGKMEAVLENPLYIKPAVTTAATGMAVTTIIVGRSA